VPFHRRRQTDILFFVLIATTRIQNSLSLEADFVSHDGNNLPAVVNTNNGISVCVRTTPRCHQTRLFVKLPALPKQQKQSNHCGFHVARTAFQFLSPAAAFRKLFTIIHECFFQLIGCLNRTAPPDFSEVISTHNLRLKKKLLTCTERKHRAECKSAAKIATSNLNSQ